MYGVTLVAALQPCRVWRKQVTANTITSHFFSTPVSAFPNSTQISCLLCCFVSWLCSVKWIVWCCHRAEASISSMWYNKKELQVQNDHCYFISLLHDHTKLGALWSMYMYTSKLLYRLYERMRFVRACRHVLCLDLVSGYVALYVELLDNEKCSNLPRCMQRWLTGLVVFT